MKSEEDQYISTENQLPSSDAATEDTHCIPVDIGQKRVQGFTVSSNGRPPIGLPTCGRVALVSLVNQSFDNNQVLQGIHYETN